MQAFKVHRKHVISDDIHKRQSNIYEKSYRLKSVDLMPDVLSRKSTIRLKETESLTT